MATVYNYELRVAFHCVARGIQSLLTVYYHVQYIALLRRVCVNTASPLTSALPFVMSCYQPL
eukprot:11202178-Lingulodinium_polyedra.AAC.1